MAKKRVKEMSKEKTEEMEKGRIREIKRDHKASCKAGRERNKQREKQREKQTDCKSSFNKVDKCNYILAAFWLAMFLYFGFRLLSHISVYAEGEREYRELNLDLSGSCAAVHREVNGSPGFLGSSFAPSAPFPEQSLKAINPDYVFWISIPGTDISYPVAQGLNPGYYLTHTFRHAENSCGSLFVQPETKVLTQGNTVVFGHNMKDGTMFADLIKYKDKDFWDTHRIIRIHYNGRWQKGIVFSCQIRTGENIQCYESDFPDSGKKQGFLNKMRASSLYPISIYPHPDRPVVTLSTCYSGSKRMIVQAVLI